MTAKASTAKKAATATPPKGIEDVNAFGQLNVDALTKASELATKAIEGINEEITAPIGERFETASKTMKSYTA